MVLTKNESELTESAVEFSAAESVHGLRYGSKQFGALRVRNKKTASTAMNAASR
jgi:hypothetical protein